MDQELQQLLDDHFLDGLANRDAEMLRSMRARCQRLETSLSYLRRLAQGRIDIVASELARRAEGGDPGDLDELVDRLPDVLSDRTRTAGVGHLPQYLATGNIEGTLVEELADMEVEARLSELPTVSAEWLTSAREHLTSYEHKVSALRRGLFERIDAIQEELIRRYRVGEATIDSVIAKG